MKKTTSKKTKVIGTKQYIDQETGELCEMEVISVEDRDFNFEKIWLSYVLIALDLIGNKKIKVLEYLLNKKNSENIVIETHRSLSKNSGVGLQTVTNTLKTLIKADVIKKIHSGAYQINPNIIFKGSHKKRMNVMLKYERNTNTKPEDKILSKKQSKI